jgi:hypothetical protein
MSRPKCLRCGAGSEWIEGRAPVERRDRSLAPVAGSALSLRAVTVKVNITACKCTMGEAREALATELRRIAETLEDEPDTFAESGNMTGAADYGGWEISDPWENDGPNKQLSNSGEG